MIRVSASYQEHLIAASRRVEPERVVAAGQRVPQMPHPRAGDLQRATCGSRSREVQAEIEVRLPGLDSLPGNKLSAPRPAPGYAPDPDAQHLASRAAWSARSAPPLAPDAVFSRSAHTPHEDLTRPELVCKSVTAHQQTCRSSAYAATDHQNVAQSQVNERATSVGMAPRSTHLQIGSQRFSATQSKRNSHQEFKAEEPLTRSGTLRYRRRGRARHILSDFLRSVIARERHLFDASDR